VIWEGLFAYLHLLAAAASGGLKLAEYWLLARPPDRLQVRLLGEVRLGYLFALIGTLATGLTRLDGGPGGSLPSPLNSMFLLKMGLFGLLVILAVGSSLTVLRWSREARSAPNFTLLTRDVDGVRVTMNLELGILALLPLPAVLLARGFGF
jgi:uncharacterized membrane protein